METTVVLTSTCQLDFTVCQIFYICAGNSCSNSVRSESFHLDERSETYLVQIKLEFHPKWVDLIPFFPL